MKQTGSLAQYFAQTERYSAALGWPDKVLITIRRKGLKEELKDVLSLQAGVPDTWPNFVQRINELDICSYERHQEVEKTSKTRSDNRDNYDRSSGQNSQNATETGKRRPNTPLPQNTSLNLSPLHRKNVRDAYPTICAILR